MIGNCFQMDEANEVGDRLHHGVGGARADEREAAARAAAAGEIDVVAHGEVLEQQRNLVGAAQAAANALVRRQQGDVLAEETHRSRGRRKVAGHVVEQRGLAGAVRSQHRAACGSAHSAANIGQCGKRAEETAHSLSSIALPVPAAAKTFGDRAHAPSLPPGARARPNNRRQMPTTRPGKTKR